MEKSEQQRDWGYTPSYQASKIDDVETGSRSSYESRVDAAADSCCGNGPWCGFNADDVNDRKLLLRRVYMALTCQLVITALVVFFFITGSKQLTFLMAYSVPLMILSAVGMFGTLIALMCCGMQEKYPVNLVLLVCFTISVSILVAIGCGSVTCIVDTAANVCLVHNGGLALVSQAFVMTMIVFLGLTAYELQTKKDFSCLGQVLCIGLGVLIAWGFFAAIFGFSTGMFYSLFGIIIFTLYILYDTSNLVNKYGPEDWIMATIQLYLDIINLFLYILRFLGQTQGRGDN